MKHKSAPAIAVAFCLSAAFSSTSAVAAPQEEEFELSEEDRAESDEDRAERDAERREEQIEAEEEKAELNHERKLEQIEAANEEEDKFGPLGCVCLSIVFPPLMPLWVVLMILVDNTPVPPPTIDNALEPEDPMEQLRQKQKAETAVAHANAPAPAALRY